MFNIFDLSAGMAGKMLTENAHRDRSLVRRSRSDGTKRVSDPAEVPIEDKLVTHETGCSLNKKSSGTPMKMLIEQEMYKEVEAWQKPPSVVAKLMGLDALPAQQLAPFAHSAHTSCGPKKDLQKQENANHGRMMPLNVQSFRTHDCGHREYKDVYEVRQSPPRTNRFKDEPLLRGRYNENLGEKRMALVRQKFMEAKRLATNQKLIQSKEFQDALDVLSSNRDLFLTFLEEPNHLFSKYLHEVQTDQLHSQTKRITVLKPSKSVDSGIEKNLKKFIPTLEANECDKNRPIRSANFIHRKPECLAQPTRIVVLKPSPGKLCQTKTLVTSPNLSPTLPECGDFLKELESNESRDSREVAEEITRQMRESFSNRRDETLLSSVLSNGYTGDESSFNRSDDDYMVDECENFSDLDAVTPTSRHSWDCMNRFDSPYSMSSFSKASYSPESSVIREAKKRLSERWVMVTSNEMSQEQKQVRRSTSTLGEMLALPETKKEDAKLIIPSISRGRSCIGDNDPGTCLTSRKIENENGGETTPRSLQRSRSVPVSSSTYENVEFGIEDLDSHVNKSATPKDKQKNGKSSFRGKVSSFFFSRNKKAVQERSSSSPLPDSHAKIQSSSNESGNNRIYESSQHATSCNHVEDFSHKSVDMAALPLEKPRASESASENLGQPSPVSVLDVPFEDDIKYRTSQPSEIANIECQQPISRSPPIESIARTLSWDDTLSEKMTLNPTKHSSSFLKADVEERNRIVFIQTLLSSAGLGNETSNSVLARWHSLESPLNPALLDRFLERKEEAAKCRERRSNQRLLFDCVNAALLEISSSIVTDSCPWSTYPLKISTSVPAATLITGEVLKLVQAWFSSKEKIYFGYGENCSQVIDHVLRKEVGGRAWVEMVGSEISEIGKEIEGQILEELVREALTDFISTRLQ